MLAEKLPILDEAAETILSLSKDITIRDMCFAREEYYREQNAIKRMIKEKDEQLIETQEELIQTKDQLSQKDRQIVQITAELQKLREELLLAGIEPNNVSSSNNINPASDSITEND